MDPEMKSYCLGEIGPFTVVADRSWPHGEAIVVEVLDRAGRGWIVKRPARQHHFRRELEAYREWVPALGDRAPVLRSWNDDLPCFIVSALPGEIGRDGDPAVYRQAGALTRRFHDSAPALPDPDFAGYMADRLEGWLARGPGLISPELADFARQQVARIAELPPPKTAPCHWDNHPRNWLVDEEKIVRFIDFGHARRQVWLLDFSRLYFDQWRSRPDLRRAFLAGYGRDLTDEDVTLIERCGVEHAVSGVVWAREHDDPTFENLGRRTLETLRAKLA